MCRARLEFDAACLINLIFVGLNTRNYVFRFAKHVYFYMIKIWQKI
jgi:hypothetical protein